MSKAMVTFIREFQFNNLVSSNVSFAFFDLRDQTANPTRIPKAMPIEESNLIEMVQKACPMLEYPIVLICETGELSRRAGESLAGLGYRNVTVLEGGTFSLKSFKPGYL